MSVSISVEPQTVRTVVKSVVDGTTAGYDVAYGHDAPEANPQASAAKVKDSLDEPKSCTTD